MENEIKGENGVVVRLRRRTLLTERTKEKMQIAAAMVFDQIVQSSGHEQSLVDEVLTGYIYVSAQVCESEGLDFEWVKLTDSPQELIAKFDKYNATRHSVFIRKVAQALFKLNAPFDEVYAPGATTTDPKS